MPVMAAQPIGFLGEVVVGYAAFAQLAEDLLAFAEIGRIAMEEHECHGTCIIVHLYSVR